MIVQRGHHPTSATKIAAIPAGMTIPIPLSESPRTHVRMTTRTTIVTKPRMYPALTVSVPRSEASAADTASKTVVMLSLPKRVEKSSRNSTPGLRSAADALRKERGHEREENPHSDENRDDGLDRRAKSRLVRRVVVQRGREGRPQRRDDDDEHERRDDETDPMPYVEVRSGRVRSKNVGDAPVVHREDHQEHQRVELREGSGTCRENHRFQVFHLPYREDTESVESDRGS